MLESTYRPGTLSMLECRFNKTTHHHAGMPPLPLLHATPFSCVSVACAHVVSCILPVFSCEVDILPFPLLHAVCTPPMGQGLSPSNWLSVPGSGRDIGHPRTNLSPVAPGEWRSGLPAVCCLVVMASAQA